MHVADEVGLVAPPLACGTSANYPMEDGMLVSRWLIYGSVYGRWFCSMLSPGGVVDGFILRRRSI